MSENFTINNPFPGLRPFEADEEHLFFGRDGQSDELLRRLRRSRFLAVLGTSGSGKSSLVRAGLLPALYGGIMTQAGSAWRVALFRPGHDPIGNLAWSLNGPEVFGDGEDDGDLQRTITEATLRRSALGLVETTRQARMPANENLLVVVDQFEEIFRFKRTSRKEGSEDEAAAFVKLLLEAKRQTDVPIYIVITMRSDFLGDCSQFRDLPEAINDGQYLIPRMTRDQRREAITGPIAVGGGEMSPRLVNRLLNDVGDNPDQLPILQHALMRTWDFWTNHRRDGEPIDLHDYEAVGTMADALSRHADEAYNELPGEASRRVAEKLFKSLTEKGSDNREIRRPTRVKEICAVAEVSEREVIAVIERFRLPGRSFLMPPTNVELGAESLIDISHESLIRGWERLRKWVDEEARSAQIYRRLAETAALHKEGNAGLWHDPDLALALNWREKNKPNTVWAQHYNPNFDEAMGFLVASKAAREAEIAAKEQQRRREIRRTRLFSMVLSVAFLISLGFGAFAYDARNKAYAARNDAVEQRNRAETARIEAVAARNEAITSKKTAEEKALEAEIARAKEEEQAQAAQAARRKEAEQARLAKQQAEIAKQASQRARQKQLEAEEQRQAAERSNLEVGKQNFASNSTIVSLSDRLIQLTSPREAVVWRNYKADALSMLLKPEESAAESTAALEIEPGYLPLREHRGYMYMLTHQPLKARKDYDEVIKLKPNSSLPYLNRAIALGQLGEFASALVDMEKAISLFRRGEYESLLESQLSPEIERVTRRSFLSTDEADYYVALHYEKATLQAAAGDPNFLTSLQIADQQRALRPSDVYLTSLNWAWLHTLERPQDYGILAVQAALWERLGHFDLAHRDYDILRKNAEGHQPQLARWAGEQEARLRSRDLNAPSVARDPEMLLLEARVLSARENLPGALQRLDEAIALVSENVNSQLYIRLLLQRAVVRFQLQDYAGSEQDANAVLAKVQTPAAHYYRARGMNWRDWKGTRNDVMADLREALRLDPSYGPALRYLASMTEGTESLDLYRRLATIWPNGAWIYKEIAVLENKRGHNEEALRSIDAAIEIYNENRVFYDVKAEIETSLGRPDAEVQRHQIDGYKQAAASLLKHDKEEATDVYVQLARLLSRFGKRGNQEAFSADLAFVKSKLADLREFYSEFVSGRIQTMNAIDGSKREVVIDRGSDDGVVLGVEGVVRSIYSKTGDHERNFQKIGKARIVSVEPKSARVEVTMDNPAGDGLVRVGDLVEVKAKVPPLPERSVLWGLAKNHITLTSENGDHLFDDFRELYADENEQRVNQQLEGMLSDIRKIADLTAPEMNKKLTQGRFKDQTVRQAAQNATRADLLTFLNFIMKYPAFSGQEWKIGRTFIYWVEQGMPQ